MTETERATPVKTRIMAGGYQATRQQVVRLDREPSADILPITEDALIARLTALAPRVDGILVSDYGYGTLTARVFERIRAIARKEGTIVTVIGSNGVVRVTNPGPAGSYTITIAASTNCTGFEPPCFRAGRTVGNKHRRRSDRRSRNRRGAIQR